MPTFGKEFDTTGETLASVRNWSGPAAWGHPILEGAKTDFH